MWICFKLVNLKKQIDIQTCLSFHISTITHRLRKNPKNPMKNNATAAAMYPPADISISCVSLFANPMFVVTFWNGSVIRSAFWTFTFVLPGDNMFACYMVSLKKTIESINEATHDVWVFLNNLWNNVIEMYWLSNSCDFIHLG